MTIISAYTSTKRIQGYLQGEEKTSHRGMTTTSCPDIQKREKDEVEIILEGRFGIQEVTLLDFRSKVQIPIGRLTCVQGRSYLCYNRGMELNRLRQHRRRQDKYAESTIGRTGSTIRQPDVGPQLGITRLLLSDSMAANIPFDQG